MRSFLTTCLALTLLLPIGCASIPKTTAQNKAKSNLKDADKFLAAKNLEDQGKTEAARVMYEELLVKQPDEPVYLHRLGVVCTQLQRYGEAKNYYERARLKDPKNVALLSDMGYAAYLRGDSVEAEQLLREAIHLKPSYKKASSNLALVVGRQGKFDECLELLRNVGGEANALAGLGYIHVLRGEYDLAELRYRAALQVDPNYKEASAALADLPKKRPVKDLSIVQNKSALDEPLEFAEVPAKAARPKLIQQASALDDESNQPVKSALFVETPPEPSHSKKPKDEDEPDWLKQPAASGVTTANRLTFGPSQEPPRQLVETSAEDLDELFARPASADEKQ